jgi:hypothetical protein
MVVLDGSNSMSFHSGCKSGAFLPYDTFPCMWGEFCTQNLTSELLKNSRNRSRQLSLPLSSERHTDPRRCRRTIVLDRYINTDELWRWEQRIPCEGVHGDTYQAQNSVADRSMAVPLSPYMCRMLRGRRLCPACAQTNKRVDK